MVPMAARRLIAVLVALLLISSFIAALAPPPASEETTSTEQTTTGPVAGSGGGAVIKQRVGADAGEPVPLEATVGDRLQLVVEVADATPVRIRGLGRSEFGTPLAPARFDLLLRRSGTFAVTVGEGTAVARLRVTP